MSKKKLTPKERLQKIGELIEFRDHQASAVDGSVDSIMNHITEKDIKKKHHERAQFELLDGTWYFLDGIPVTPKQFVREQPKVGRNDPCPCGSGKKYKKCCAV